MSLEPDDNRGAMAAARKREAARQQALVAAVAGIDFDADADADGDADASASAKANANAHGKANAKASANASGIAAIGTAAAAGISAYRANAAMVAERALAAAFPTVQMLIGHGDFAHLAREFRRRSPPERGDLGEWGDAFPAWLRRHAALTEWPYVGDCAALDLAIHRCERAADAQVDTASFAQLDRVEPGRLRLVLMPGAAALASVWPIVTIHAAHCKTHVAAETAAAADFAAVRRALESRRGERVLVVRDGWRARIDGVDHATFAWTCDLLRGVDLGTALDQAGAAFDFAGWLATALRRSWLQAVVAVEAPADSAELAPR